MTVSKDDAKARRGFCALLLAGLGILAVGKWTDTLALKDGLLAALVLLACSLAVQCLPRRVRAFALMAAVPVLAQCLQAVSTDIGVFLYFKLLPKLWALALWLLLFCLLWGLLGRPGLAGGVCVTVSVLLALLNLALLQFRGTALQWQDIGSWRAALNVAGGYRLALSHKIAVLAALWLWALAALHWAGGLCAGAPLMPPFRVRLFWGGRPVRGRAPVGRVPGGHGPWGRCSRCAVVGLAAHSGQRGDLLLHQHPERLCGQSVPAKQGSAPEKAEGL